MISQLAAHLLRRLLHYPLPQFPQISTVLRYSRGCKHLGHSVSDRCSANTQRIFHFMFNSTCNSTLLQPLTHTVQSTAEFSLHNIPDAAKGAVHQPDAFKSQDNNFCTTPKNPEITASKAPWPPFRPLSAHRRPICERLPHACVRIVRGRAAPSGRWDRRTRRAPKLGIQAWLGHPYAPKQHRSIYRHPRYF
jgi:hypothetical protein